MTIIVTGGAGFIGSNFVFHMLDKYSDYRIVCLDKLTYAGNLSTLAPVMNNPNFRFVKMDICDREGVYNLFEEEHPDVVVNFAAESHVDRSIENPEISCARALPTFIIPPPAAPPPLRPKPRIMNIQKTTRNIHGSQPRTISTQS